MLPHFQRKLPRTPSCGRWRLLRTASATIRAGLDVRLCDAWFFSAHVNDHCCCQFSPSSQTPFIKPSCELMLSFAHSLRLLCSSWCPILHLFCLHLKVASALVAKMRTKSTTRIVSHFCVRRCLLFTVRAHVPQPLLYIREEESTRRCSPLPPCTFVEYLSAISKATQHALFR